MLLSRRGDFVAALHRVDGTPWPTGTVCTLTIGDLSWTATVDAAYLRWNVDKAVVAALTEDTYPAELTLTQGAGDVAWATGKAYVQ